jgi:chromosome segregation ATPase
MEPRPEREEKGTAHSPAPGPSLTPIIRPTVRRPPQSILGENTPPQSATMLALQNMSTTYGPALPPPKEPETPLANITNGSTALVKVPQGLESLSNQILTLTNIATTLQKEMSQLSRRSRDNATDLLSLKEATNARDEDIRKSLRDLINDAKHHKSATRDSYGGPLLLEGRHHPTSPTSLSKSVRPFSLPRIPSPNSFAASLDRESLLSTPSLVADSPSTVALLEKIIRDMGTRDGQDSLLSSLTELQEKLQGFAIAEKVDELLRIVKANQQQAVVAAAGGNGGGDGGGHNTRHRAWSFSDDGEGSRRDLDFGKGSVFSGRTGRLLQDTDSRRSSAPTGQKSEFINEDVIKAIRTVKDSVAQGGGLTAEVKALVRELRGEVLGMGRELGRRLDEVVAKNTTTSGKLDANSKAEMTRVVEEGIAEMREHMNDVLREHRRQSSATTISRESTIDYKEIYNSMRAALKDSQASKPRVPEVRREDVVQAVKDAWEKYKPEIEIQQIGLERHEVLECLKEGLREYAPQDDHPPGATREEVFKAVVEGLKHYVPPQVDTPATLSRDEILEAVRECLEEFEFPVAPSTGPDLSKDDMLDAVREGLHTFDFPTSAPPPPPMQELTRDDVLDAVNQGLHTFDFSAIHSSALVTQPLTKADVSEAVKQGLKAFNLAPDMVDAVRDGIESANIPTDVFRAVSEALKNFDFASVYSSALVPRSDLSRVDVADAIKDGLDSLQISAEVQHAVNESLKSFDFTSVYSAALVPRSDLSRVDVADAVKDGLDSLNISHDVEEAVKKGLQSVDFSSVSSSALVVPSSGLSRVDVADAVKEGLESLDLNSGMVRAVQEGLESFNFPSSVTPSSALVPLSSDNDEVVRRLQELRDYFDVQFQAVSDEAKQNMAANGRDTEQVLDATKDGFEKLRQDIEIYVDRARGDPNPGDTMAHLVSTLDGFREEIAELLASSTESSKELLRGEIESLRDAVNSSLVPAIPQGGHGGGSKEFIEALQDGLSSLRTDISTRPLGGVSEILDALQEGLGDIRHSIDKLHDKPADLTANDEILDALKNGLDSVRSDIDELREESKNDRALATIGEKEENNAMIPAEPPLKHDDIKNIESLLTQLGAKVEALESAPPPVVESLAKEDLAEIQEKLQNVAESVSDISKRELLEGLLEPLESLASLEDRVKTIQDAVAELLAREPIAAPAAPALTDPATREDVEAIETILRNTKARLDDLIDGEQAVNKEHIDSLETQFLETRELLGELRSSLEPLSRKEDITMVESLVTQIISSFDEMKERHEKALEDPERVTKTDIDAVEAICLDTKVVIEQILKSDLNVVATKDDVLSLETLLKDYRERVEARSESDSKALEVRQAEMATVGERVAEVKSILDEFRDVMRNKLEDGAKGIDAIHGIIHAMNDAVRKNANVSDDLKEMFDTMKIEFEDSRAGVVGAKLETDEKFQVTIDTLTAKLDEQMGELFTKYDEFQVAQDERAAKGEERDVEMEAAVVGTKAIAEELKLLIDTLGSTVTDSLEKMEEASKTVFERVEELVNKTEENQLDGKAEHQLTREQFQEVVGKVDGLHGHFTESEPKILEAIQDVMLLVNQHYEHAKVATLAIEDKIEEAKPPLLPPPEKYDDSVVHEKLDQLVTHTHAADKAFEHLSAIPNVHALVRQTAAELATFVAAQTQRIADEHEDREKTLQDTIVALERRLEEKEQAESLIASLREEEARLKESIHVTLKAEQQELKDQFLANLVEEESRLKSANADLKAEQDNLREIFMASLKEEQARLMEMNVAIKEEQDQLKETFLYSLREEQARLNELNDSIREEHQELKDTLLANLREEELLLKEANASLRSEQEQLREAFVASLKEEEQRLKEANDILKQEHEQIRATLREDNERLKVELLANLMEEEQRLKDVNASLREEQDRIKEEFFNSLKEEEQRLKESLHTLRDEYAGLATKKSRIAADLSATETALQIRREDVQFMEAKAETLERRILEGVMDHSRVLLMAKQKRPGGRESMSRKRVASQKITDEPMSPTPVEDTKSRAAFDIAMAAKSKLNAPTPPGSSRRILSLSQITNNTPTGGLKRSQSVRTAVGPGRLRKASWAGGNRAAKGYGDLEKDKENLQLKESDEDNDSEPDNEFQDPPPVDIVISRAESIFSDGSQESPTDEPADNHIPDDPINDYDTLDLDGDRMDEISESETLRRSSRGTTVITSTESYAESGDYSGEEDEVDDAASDWTESVVGTESAVGTAVGVEN